MATSKAILAGWLGLIALLWASHPLLFSQARVVVLMAMLTGLLAVAGYLTGVQLLVACSGGLGLVNLTATLVLTGHPLNLWLGLSAGLALFALLDGSQRYSYLKHCQVEAGVLTAWLWVFIRVSGLSFAAGVALMLLLIALASQSAMIYAAGLVTIVGALMFVGAVALFLRYASRWSVEE